jgi:hypothetical protein
LKKTITFEDFEPGTRLGEHLDAYSADMAQAWQRIFGEHLVDGGAEAASVAMVLSMRAFLGVVSPRPPGNVHAREQFSLFSLPTPGEQVRSVVSCVAKEIKRERFYVDLDVAGTGDGGRALYSGRMSLIWAA